MSENPGSTPAAGNQPEGASPSSPTQGPEDATQQHSTPDAQASNGDVNGAGPVPSSSNADLATSAAVGVAAPSDGPNKKRRRRRRRRKPKSETSVDGVVQGREEDTPPPQVQTAEVTHPTDSPSPQASGEQNEPEGSSDQDGREGQAAPTLTTKDRARYAAIKDWLSQHESELGTTPSDAQAADSQELTLDTVWQADTELYQALVGERAKSLPTELRTALVKDALDKTPTLKVLTVLLELAWATDSELESTDPELNERRPPPPTEPPQADPSERQAPVSTTADEGATGGGPNTVGAGATDAATTEADTARDRTAETEPSQTVNEQLDALLGDKGPFDVLRRVECRGGDMESVNRLLSLVENHVPRPQWIEWLLSMYENRDLRRSLEGDGPIPQSFRALIPHARTLAAVVVRGQTNQWGARQLHHSTRTMLRSGASSLMSRPAAMRERLVRIALRLRLKEQDVSALSNILDSLGSDACASSLALDHVRGLLSAHHYEKAAKVLAALSSRGERDPQVAHWLKALSGPRYGSVALLKSRTRPPLSTEHPLRPGLWLAQQRDVWLRVGTSERAAHFAQHVDDHRRSEIPGVSTIVEHGFTKGNRPYVAYERKGENAKFALAPAHGASREEALDTARQLLKLAYGLARCGVMLPDAELGRLERDASGQLWLVETWGCKTVGLDGAQEAMLGILRLWLASVLFDSPNFALKPDIQDTLRHAADFATVRATLDVLNRTRLWEA